MYMPSKKIKKRKEKQTEKNKVNAHTCQVQNPSFLVDDKAVLHQPFCLQFS